MKIKFNVKEARDHLLLCGYVYTLRKWGNYPESCTAVFNHPNTKEEIIIGKVSVALIEGGINEETKDHLRKYISGSGFGKVDDWWAIACTVHKDTNLNLYLIETRNL